MFNPEPLPERTSIYVWPDHTWCLTTEYYEHECAGLSDDFYTLWIPDSMVDDDKAVHDAIVAYEADLWK